MSLARAFRCLFNLVFVYAYHSQNDALRPSSSGNIISAPITEDDYRLVAALGSDDAMKDFVRTVLAKSGRVVADESELSGFVPHYSGTSAVQSFAKMKDELQSADWTRPGGGSAANITPAVTPTATQTIGSMVRTLAAGSGSDAERGAGGSSELSGDLLGDSPALRNLGGGSSETQHDKADGKAKAPKPGNASAQQLRHATLGDVKNKSGPGAKAASHASANATAAAAASKVKNTPGHSAKAAPHASANATAAVTASKVKNRSGPGAKDASHANATAAVAASKAAGPSVENDYGLVSQLRVLAAAKESDATARLVKAADGLKRASMTRKSKVAKLKAITREEAMLNTARAKASADLTQARMAKANTPKHGKNPMALEANSFQLAEEVVNKAALHFNDVVRKLVHAKSAKKKLNAAVRVAQQQEEQFKQTRVTAAEQLQQAKKDRSKAEREDARRLHAFQQLAAEEAKSKEVRDKAAAEYEEAKQALADAVKKFKAPPQHERPAKDGKVANSEAASAKASKAGAKPAAAAKKAAKASPAVPVQATVAASVEVKTAKAKEVKAVNATAIASAEATAATGGAKAAKVVTAAKVADVAKAAKASTAAGVEVGTAKADVATHGATHHAAAAPSPSAPVLAVSNQTHGSGKAGAKSLGVAKNKTVVSSKAIASNKTSAKRWSKGSSSPSSKNSNIMVDGDIEELQALPGSRARSISVTKSVSGKDRSK